MNRVLSRFSLSGILFVFFLVSLGCHGGDNKTASHAPTISNLYGYPNSANQNDGNGSVAVNYNLDFTDAGGDLASMTVSVYDGNGNLLTSLSDSISGASGFMNGYMYGTLYADTTIAGSYTIEFFLSDSLGAESNKLSFIFNVIPPASIVSLAVTPVRPFIDKGTSQQFNATATYSDSTILNVTSQVTWTSSDQSIATINATGLATGISTGTTTITATAGNVSDSTSLQVMVTYGTATHYPEPQGYSTFLGNSAMGDLNSDGLNDVAAIGWNSQSIFIYYQDSSHALISSQVITADITLSGIAIEDVNNDGLADLIVSGNSATTAGPLGRVYVYTQNSANHTLNAPQKYVLSTDNVIALAVADLNNDGLPDIVTTGTGTITGGIVSFMFQKNDGTLDAEVAYTSVPVFASFSAGEVHVADMNNDGLNDVVLQSGAKQLAVIKQTSPGIFSASPDYYTVQTSYWPNFVSFALGDLNGDGRMDIAVADLGNDGYLNIFLQDNSGILTGPTVSTISYNIQNEIHIADMDGDGLNDIIISSGGNAVYILYQNADHTFQGPRWYYFNTYSSGGTLVHQAVCIGDVTSDGLPDIVEAWFTEGLYVLPRLP